MADPTAHQVTHADADDIGFATGADGNQLAWARYGRTGPRVLMVMGLGMRGIVWRPQLDELRADHQLVVYDARGLGASDDPPGLFTMTTLAADALAVADAQGWEMLHVVGVSLGGMVSQHVALAAPGRLRSLSLIATQPGGRLAWVPPLAGLRPLLATQRARTTEARAAATDRLLFTRGVAERVPPDVHAQRHADTVAHPAPEHTVRRQFRAVVGHRAKHRLHEITAPTLIVQPAEDNLIRPRHSETLARGIPRARLVRIRDAAHGVLVEQAARVNGHLREHIGRHDATG